MMKQVMETGSSEMKNMTVERIEADIDRLSLADQLWLMERLAQRIRRTALPAPADLASQLAGMANDPDIQRELRQIEAEFAVADLDGLDAEP